MRCGFFTCPEYILLVVSWKSPVSVPSFLCTFAYCDQVDTTDLPKMRGPKIVYLLPQELSAAKFLAMFCRQKALPPRNSSASVFAGNVIPD